MPEIRNLFTDYNGTIDPKYLEMPLAYALAQRHHERGEFLRECSLRIPGQCLIWSKYFRKGSDAVLPYYVNKVLKGETRDALDDSMRRVIDMDGNLTRGLFIRAMKWCAGMADTKLSEKIGERISGEFDPEAVEVFEKAREKGMPTGIYSRSLRPLIQGYLKGTGKDVLFDTVMANELLYEDGVVAGLQERVASGKPGFSDDLAAAGFDARETAYVDDRDMAPLEQAGLGILAPGAKEETRERCEGTKIKIVSRWGEVGDLLGLWSPD